MPEPREDVVIQDWVDEPDPPSLPSEYQNPGGGIRYRLIDRWLPHLGKYQRVRELQDFLGNSLGVELVGTEDQPGKYAEGYGQGADSGVSTRHAQTQAGLTARHALDFEQRERFKEIEIAEKQAARELQERILAITEARETIEREIDREKNAATAAYQAGNLAEQNRHNQAIEALQARASELAAAEFQWKQQAETARFGLEEQRNRIQEAQVTGYYRPTAETSFGRPASLTAINAAAPGTSPTLARAQVPQSLALMPGGVGGSPTVAPTPAPLDTRNKNLEELAKAFATPQTGPQAQGSVAQAPNSQPNEAQVTSEQRVVKRTVTEVFGR